MISIKKTFPALLLGLSLAAGCETLGLGGDEDKSDDRVSRDDRISRDRPARRDRPGFEMKYPADFDNGVPSGARLVREVNEDGSVTYKTPHDGRLYVYDVDNRRVEWDGQMRDGEAFTLDSRDDRATLNGRSINIRLDRDSRYRLYFVEDASSSYNSSRDRSTDRDYLDMQR
jgi:hypothetical protein